MHLAFNPCCARCTVRVRSKLDRKSLLSFCEARTKARSCTLGTSAHIKPRLRQSGYYRSIHYSRRFLTSGQLTCFGTERFLFVTNSSSIMTSMKIMLVQRIIRLFHSIALQRRTSSQMPSLSSCKALLADNLTSLGLGVGILKTVVSKGSAFVHI